MRWRLEAEDAQAWQQAPPARAGVAPDAGRTAAESAREVPPADRVRRAATHTHSLYLVQGGTFGM